MRDVIPAALAGERVDRVVAMVAGVSRREAAELIAAGAVQLDGGAVTAGSTRVREGADIVIDVERLAAEPPLAADASVPVVVVVRRRRRHRRRQAGRRSSCIPGGPDVAGTLVNGLLARYPELADVGDAGAARHRAPSRQGHLGAAGRGPHARGLRRRWSLSCGRTVDAAGYRARVGRARVGRWCRRRAHRPLDARPHPHGGRPEGKAARTRYEC